MCLPHIHNKCWEAYVKEGILALVKCDAILLLSNWEDSKGAKIEKELAEILKIEVIYHKDYIKYKPKSTIN